MTYKSLEGRDGHEGSIPFTRSNFKKGHHIGLTCLRPESLRGYGGQARFDRV
jgi:hypothetical protein